MGASRNRSPDGGHPADPQLARRHNLPTRLTSFVGREAALAEAMHLLEDSRLVTLVGSGGIGKTRLALRIATVLVDVYPHGAWLVELAPVADPLLVPLTVAAALGVHEQPRPADVRHTRRASGRTARAVDP